VAAGRRPFPQVGGELLPLLHRHEHPLRVARAEGKGVAAVAGADLQFQARGPRADQAGPVGMQVERDGRFVSVRKDHPLLRFLASIR